MAEPSISECFHLLKVRRGADFSTVKQAYRKNLYKCHPDRFQGRPGLLPVAERKTKRLVQVYGILEQWYQANGGTDLASTDNGAAKDPFPDPDESPGDGEASPAPYLSRFGLFAALVVAVLAILAWRLNSGPSRESERPAPAGDGPAAVHAPAPVFPAAKIDKVQQDAPQAQAPLESRTAELNAMVAERDHVKSAWVRGYVHDREQERGAAEGELAAAQAGYDRYMLENESKIGEAKDAAALQIEQARRESAVARDTFARQEQAALGELRRTYDNWLSARGNDAVALIKEIRMRENSGIGVFSDTEDPTKIFEFWTAEEAGGPEVNIAAKTGVTVLQPDARFFPHFRSNIFLYGTQGQVLVRMMGSIVEKHDALLKEIGSRTKTDDAALANWDTAHPMAPIRLSGPLQLVAEGRDRALDRLAKAQLRLKSAGQALSPSETNTAFSQSPEGKKWAARISDALDGIAPVKGAH